MKNLKQYLFLFLSITIFFACEDDEPIIPAPIEIDGAYSNGVFISNEGTYGVVSGSVSFYDFEKDLVSNNIFKTVNNRVLGDVVQSITICDTLAFIVVNGSNKIEIVKANDFVEQGVITDVTSPRYIVGVDNTKAYVSQWGNGTGTELKVIDYATLSIRKTITVGTGPERMLLFNDHVYVANSGGWGMDNTISVIDISTDNVVKTITLDGDSPRDFVVDANNNIWILCTGNEYGVPETASKLIRINPITNEVEQTITIGESYHPTCMEVSKNGNNIFYGAGYGVQGIYKMSIDATTVPATPLIDKSFYGFNINPETGNIFAMEATSFTANGMLWRYETNGTLLGSYEAGVGPNGTSKKK